jgi:hypothetical protein
VIEKNSPFLLCIDRIITRHARLHMQTTSQYDDVNSELCMKSPSVSPPISSAFGLFISSFSGICKVMNFLILNLGTKCWNSAFIAQGSRVIISSCTFR